MTHWLREDFGRDAEARVLDSYFVKSGFFKADYVRQLFAQHRAGRELATRIWVLINLVEWFNYWID